MVALRSATPLFALGMACIYASHGYALSGSGDSSTGTIDTVRPTVVSQEAIGPREIRVTYSEPLYEPVSVDPMYYTLGGETGNLHLVTEPPALTIIGDLVYSFTWLEGEMGATGDIYLTPSLQRDLVGNLLDDTNIPQAPATGDAPTPGTPVVPSETETNSVLISFSGAADASSDIAEVRLYYRRAGGAWTEAPPETRIFDDHGTFEFVAPGSAPDYYGIYYFQLVAIDEAFNTSPIPSGPVGEGQGHTTFGATLVGNWWILE